MTRRARMTRRVRATRPAGERGAETARSRPPEAASDDLGGEPAGLRTRSGRGKKILSKDQKEGGGTSVSSSETRRRDPSSPFRPPREEKTARRAKRKRRRIFWNRDARPTGETLETRLFDWRFRPAIPIPISYFGDFGRLVPSNHPRGRLFSRLGGGGGEELGEEIFDPEHPPLDGVQPVAHLDSAEPRPNLASSTRRGIPRQTARE